MRSRARIARSVAIWLVATATGIGVSWFGIRPLLDAAVPDRPVAFPASGPRTPPPPSTAPSPGSQALRPRDAGPGASARASRSPSPAAPADPSPSAAAPPPVPDGWTPTGDGWYLRTFRLVGGTATVRAGDGAVELVSATPRPGYVMAVTPAGNGPLRVAFTMITRASELEVRWADGRPDATVTEVP